MSLPRYPAYKDSGVEWVGEVPVHWQVQPLKRGYSIFGGSTPKSDVAGYWDGNIDWVTPADLSRLSGFEILGSLRRITDEGLKSCGTSVVPPGSLILSTRAPIGSVGLAIAPLCTNQGCKALVPRGDQNSRFAAYTMSVAGPALNVRGKGTTFLELSGDELARFPLAFPDVNEQLAITKFLDRETAKIDALIAEQEKLLTLLAEKRHATISHAVTRGLDPNAPMKDSGIPWLGEVPAHWEVSPLKYISRIGNGSTPHRDNPDYWSESGFPWLNSSVVNHDEVREAERFVTELALRECHLPVIRPPAVLVGITGQGKTRGMAAPLMFEATINQHLAYIIPSPGRLEVSFLLRALQMAYDNLRTDSESAGSTKGAITCDQLSRFAIPLPPLNEQSAIAQHVDSEAARFSKLGSDSRQAISLLKERRSALIAAAVTGKIDVRDSIAQQGGA